MDVLGRSVFRVWVQEFKQWEMCVCVCMHVREGWERALANVWKIRSKGCYPITCDGLNKQLFKLEVYNSAQAQRGPWNWKYKLIKMHCIDCVSIHVIHMHDTCSWIILARPRVRSVCHSLLHAFCLFISLPFFKQVRWFVTKAKCCLKITTLN